MNKQQLLDAVTYGVRAGEVTRAELEHAVQMGEATVGLSQSAPQLAIGRDGGVAVWCEHRGYDAEGWEKFFVINGHWHGRIKDGVVRVDGMDNEHPGEVLWRGAVPSAFQKQSYRDAIPWIQEQLRCG